MNNQEHKPNSMLLVSGSLLMILGIIVLIFSSWDMFSPLGRIFTVLLPLVGLYVLSIISWRRPAYRLIARYALMTSSAILPFVAGVVIFQSNLYPHIDTTLTLYCAIISLIGAASFELFLRQREQAIVTLISIATVTSTVSTLYAFSTIVTAWIVLGVSLVLLMLGVRFIDKNERLEGALFSGIGLGGILVSMAYIPLGYDANSWSENVLYTATNNSHIGLIAGYFLISVLMIMLAGFFGNRWLKNKNDELLHSLRQVTENVSAMALTIPAIILLFNQFNAANAIICIILGCVALSVSYSIQVTMFRVLGGIAIAIGVIRIIFFALSSLSALWPILMLLAGFLLFVIAFMGTYLRERSSKLSVLWNPPSTTMFGLGEPLPERERPVFTHYASNGSALDQTSMTNEHSEGWKWLLIILGLMLLISFI